MKNELSTIGKGDDKLGQESDNFPIDGETQVSIGIKDIDVKAKYLEGLFHVVDIITVPILDGIIILNFKNLLLNKQ